MLLQRRMNRRKGQGLVEYALLIAGVALICAAAVSIFGHKTSDLIAAVATILPGAHADDNAAIQSGRLMETTEGDDTTPIKLDVAGIQKNGGTERLAVNVLGAPGAIEGFGGLVTEP